MNARMDAAPAGGTQVVAAPAMAAEPPAAPPPDDEEWDESQAYSAVQSAYDDSRESRASGRGDEWTNEQSAAYAAPRSEWGYTDERSAQMSARRPAARRRRRDDDWDDDEFAEIARSHGGRNGRDDHGRDDRARGGSRRGGNDEYDDRYDEDYGRRSRRRRDEDGTTTNTGVVAEARGPAACCSR